MKVGKLTLAQKKLIANKEFAEDSYFNPIQDLDGNWIISEQEMKTDSPEFTWVKDLPLIDFNPKPDQPKNN